MRQLTPKQILEAVKKWVIKGESGKADFVYIEDLEYILKELAAKDELSTEQKEQRRLDDKMIHLFHMILDSQIKLYDAFQTLTEPEDEPEGWQKEMMADYVRDDGYEQEDS